MTDPHGSLLSTQRGPATRNAQTETRARVLLLLPSLAGGGMERQALHIVRHVDRDTFDLRVGVIAAMGAFIDQVEARWIFHPGGGRWDKRANNRKWLSPSRMLDATAAPSRVYRMLQTFRPDVVVSFEKMMAFCAIPALAAYGRRNTAWIVREGNNVGAVIDEEVGSGIASGLLRWATGCTYRQADIVVTISDGLAGGLEHDVGIDRERIRRVHNAVDLDLVLRRATEPCPIATERFLLAAGRLVRQKGFDVLIRAFAGTVARGNTKLVILGEGPERPMLESLVRQLGLSGHVILAGFADNPWSYMARATAFVLPSRWEGFGNVVVEAMACGTPVIVTSCDYGPREIVRDGESGLVVGTDDVAALTHAIEMLLLDEDLRTRLAEAGAARARDFDVRRVVRSYEDVFRAAHLCRSQGD